MEHASVARTNRRGLLHIRNTWRPLRPMERFACEPGPVCTSNPGRMRVRVTTRRRPRTAVLSCCSKSPSSLARPERRKRSGSGGEVQDSRTSPCFGEHTPEEFLEHTFRFLKGILNWDKPRVRTPEQAEQWSWLVLLAFTQLRLARAVLEDARLPWQAPQAQGRLTPSRARQGFAQLLPRLGTPAAPPKPCGHSPGRPSGRRSPPATRYPAVKRTA